MTASQAERMPLKDFAIWVFSQWTSVSMLELHDGNEWYRVENPRREGIKMRLERATVQELICR